MIHELKIEPGFFEDVANGSKKFEVRKLDRGFLVGDYLALNEYESEEEYADAVGYTGRCMLVRVTYFLMHAEYCKQGYCVMGIEPAAIIMPNQPEEVRNILSMSFNTVPIYGREDE